MNLDKNNNQLTALRGFAMLLIIAGHVFPKDSWVCTWIYSFHVPLFFLLSGFLKHYSNSNLQHRIAKILKQYLYWSIILIVVRVLLAMIFHNAIVFIPDIVDTFTFWGVSTLWFLPALCISEIVFAGIKKISELKVNNSFYEKYVYAFSVVILSVLCVCLRNNSVPNNMEGNYSVQHLLIIIGRGFCGCVFETVGYVVKKYFDKTSKNVLLFLCGLMVCANALICSKNGNVDLHYMLLGSNWALYFPCAMIGGIGLLGIFYSLPYRKIRVLEFFGRNSIDVMAIHEGFNLSYIIYRIGNKLFTPPPFIICYYMNGKQL